MRTFIHPFTRWTSGLVRAGECSCCTSLCHLSADLKAAVRPVFSPGCSVFSAAAGGRRKSVLRCFWPLVSQIFNHETFLWEWEFPVNSIPAETGPINTLALCYRVYLAGQWISPCKQEAPEVIIYRCGWRATCLYLWALKTVWKAKENAGEPLVTVSTGLPAVQTLCSSPHFFWEWMRHNTDITKSRCESRD